MNSSALTLSATARFPVNFANPSANTDGSNAIRPSVAQISEVTQSVADCLLRVLVPLVASDPNNRVEPRFLKYMPPYRRKRAITINRVCRQYLAFARTYYRKHDGTISQEVCSIDYALAQLRKHYGRARITDLGPRKLIKVRDSMIEKGWCRKPINQQIGRIKRMVKWGVENEIVPPSVFHGLQAVSGLRMGRSAARESEPVKPAPEHLIEAVLPLVSSPIGTMIRVQLLTGMRPGEICTMRLCDIDRTRQPWAYRPSHHKTEHFFHERVVFLGPKTQELLLPFLKEQSPEAFLFSPTEAVREKQIRRHAARVTPLSCGNVPGSNRKRRPKRSPGDRYCPNSYCRAIVRACRTAFPVPIGLRSTDAIAWRRQHSWHPHQLRHNAATSLRKHFGLDIAQIILGHKTLTATQIYAERDMESAQRVMAEIG